jgi:uncharacterized protein YfaS (alpha-2-macroglobulin family)
MHPQGQQAQTHTGRTDASGQHHLRVDLLGVDPPQAQSLTAEASVMDVNRQAWAASASALVHPAELYVGLRTARNFVQPGEPLLLDAVVTDLDGKAVAGSAIELKLVRLDWTWEAGEWSQTEAAAQTQTLQSGAEPVQARFTTSEGGTYKLTAHITDQRNRKNRSEMTVWVAGGKQPPQRSVEQEKVTLVPDREAYAPGEEAALLVQAPFVPAEGLLTLRRGGIVQTQRFTMDQPTTTLRVALTEQHLPTLHVHVDLVGAAPRPDDSGQVDPKLPPRPAYAAGSLALPVSLASRTLALEPAGRSPAARWRSSSPTRRSWR